MLQVGRQVPGKLASPPDHPVLRHGENQRYDHTATLARIGGCGS
jgi:hypothetical protein